MTLDEALEILNKYDGTEMTDEQYYNYHCAQNKITRLILSGKYELVKREPVGPEKPQGDLVSRSALKEEIYNNLDALDTSCFTVARIIDNAPTVEERPQGEWIDTGDMNEYWAEEYQCSICGAKDHWHNFCPNCGASMKKGGAK